jgi:hypothetical protein
VLATEALRDDARTRVPLPHAEGERLDIAREGALALAAGQKRRGE